LDFTLLLTVTDVTTMCLQHGGVCRMTSLSPMYIASHAVVFNRGCAELGGSVSASHWLRRWTVKL